MALVGNLKDLKLPNLIQINCMEKNTAKLTIEYGGKYGSIYFQGGQIVHAEYDPDIGEQALFRMLTFPEGKFKVEGGIRPPSVTIKSHWNNLLLEGLHQLDEERTSDEGKHNHLIEMMMNVRGVKHTAILSSEGDVIATNYDVGDGSILHALSFHEIHKLKELLGFSAPGVISLIEHQNRVLLIGYKNNIVCVVLEAKHQLETVLPFINQVLA
jgi:predicted regulator of Ras-like GTPase activity (Roadblock/LC7/MglB family)